MFVLSGYAWYNYSTLNRNLNTVAVVGLGSSGAPSGAPTATDTGAAQNLLLVGLDSRAGLSSAEKRRLHLGQDDLSISTDTIVLVHIPANGQKATLVSIPRDSWVHIPGFQPDKINAAYADGCCNQEDAISPKDAQQKGASKLVSVVKALTGVEIDQYVQIGFAGFEEVVKAIGTVPVNLCQSVSDRYSGFSMTAGRHNLTARQALAFVRQRHNIPGSLTDDYGREERQRYFLRQAFSSIASADTLLNPVKLHRLIDAIDDAITFGNPNVDLAKFADQMSNLSAGNITGTSIPTHGSNAEYGLIVHPAEVRAKVRALFYPAPSTPSSTSPTSATSSNSTPPKRSCVY